MRGPGQPDALAEDQYRAPFADKPALFRGERMQCARRCRIRTRRYRIRRQLRGCQNPAGLNPPDNQRGALVRLNGNLPAGCAIGGHDRLGVHRNITLRADANPATGTGCGIGVGFDAAGNFRRTGIHFDRNFSGARAARGNDTFLREFDLLAGLQQYFAVFTLDHGIRAQRAGIGDQSCIDADAPGIGDDLTEVARFVFGRHHLDTQVRCTGIDEFDAFAGREHHFAPGRRNDAAVRDGGAHQIYRATCGVDRTVVQHGAGARCFGEFQPPGQKIGVGEIQRRGDETRGIDLRAGSERDAVRIDEVNATVGLQRPEYHRGIAAGHTIQHRARCRRL